jgi:glutamine synthetase
MDRQQEFVLRTLEERDIRFVRLWFTDVLGFLKSVAVAPAELEGAFTEGIGFDGSAIEGFARVYESDMVLSPDPATFQVLPWETPEGGHYSARMFCDVQMPDGSPSWADPRHKQATPPRRISAGTPSRRLRRWGSRSSSAIMKMLPASRKST